jgi:hypothetical protein
MRRWEIVGGIGPSFFFGDIGGYTIGKNILGFRGYELSANQI